MGINNRFEEIDKAMSRRMDEIFSDPRRHKFVSCFDFYKDHPETGRYGRSLKNRGRKTICYYCGHKKNEHAKETEDVLE